MYNHETQLPGKASLSIDLHDALLCLSCASLIKQCSTLPLEYKSIQYMEAVRQVDYPTDNLQLIKSQKPTGTSTPNGEP